ncbi:MAG: hypothetical protein KJ787_14050 [Gammaproteobacteria bacterium]|nr:hypothetical protein [Gammaproteobacteria bacterium]MBU1647450.1 hypothetical protein [Gammaproteobacteria bacterium]MBU1973242.1 hypothetical protein [Gammaproteobacteria bacterium]
MATEFPPTTAELKAAWKRAGLWRVGVSFDSALAMAPVRWAMEKSALAARRRERLPVQPALF